MKDILIKLVQTNMMIVGQDDEDNNDVEDYDTKDCISCGERGKDEFRFQCFICKSRDDRSVWDVDQQTSAV